MPSLLKFSQEGHADCIANEDGERQIACAVSFFGEEVVRNIFRVPPLSCSLIPPFGQYIGNQAKPQLVKNSQNTILGFRNLLGKT